jgi:shikimate dehydrogenase
MRKFGLIGFPLSHSFSPAFFSKKFLKEGYADCSYDAFPIESIQKLPELLEENKELEGLNITIPYKKQVIPYLDRCTTAVRQTLACNCIKIKDKILSGYNTDVIGFEKSLLPHLTNAHAAALVLGTGGAAAAVKFVLKKLQIEFLSVSRTAIPDNNIISYSDLTKEVLDAHKLIINTTPLGMYPDVNSSPDISYEFLSPQHYLYDLVYNPEKTQFLKKGIEKGCIVKNGADMLIIQAEESWKIWNDENDL